eukprot:Gb_37759 [translate_table: standard]
MSDGGNSDSDDDVIRGMDWEMVSMTSSTYAENGSNGVSAATLHSDHFVFPPSRHEGLPIEEEEQGEMLDNVENSPVESQDLSGGETVEENEEEETSGGLGMEASRGNDEESVNFLDAAEGRGLIMFNGSACEEERGNEDDPVLEPGFSIDETAQLNSPEKLGGESVSCEAWWKRQASSLGQSNKLWSIAVAAALMGIVVLGQRWQYERWQNHQIRLQLRAKEECSVFKYYRLNLNYTARYFKHRSFPIQVMVTALEPELVKKLQKHASNLNPVTSLLNYP